MSGNDQQGEKRSRPAKTGAARSQPVGGAGPVRKTARIGADLGIRIVSAVLMAVLALGLTYAGPWPFALLVAVASGVMCWEWSRVVRGTGSDPAMLAHLAAVLAACLLTALGRPGTGLLMLLFGAAAMSVLQRSGHQLMSVVGVLYCGLPAVALIWIRSDAGFGLSAVLLLLLIVWGTDTAAYFFGRLIGGPKLWPRLSPNKTWAGLGGGALAGAVMGYGFALAVGTPQPLALAGLGLVLALTAQMGDLGESALKRHFGVKDSSGLIPGHGGLLDRVDGLVTVAVAAALLALLREIDAPGHALLLLP